MKYGVVHNATKIIKFAHEVNMLTLPQKKIYNSLSERNLFLAGIGAGKTHALALMAAKYITKYPEAIGLIAANSYSQLNISTVKRMFEVWQQDFNIYPDRDYVINKQPPRTF